MYFKINFYSEYSKFLIFILKNSNKTVSSSEVHFKIVYFETCSQPVFRQLQ
jgi:hypothetical protein